MLTIRLQRVGKKKQPVFRIVLAEKHRAASKLALEFLGHYNPRTKEFAIKDESRLKYWIEQHVEISPTVYNLFVTKGIVPGKKVQAWRPKMKDKAVEAATVAAPKTETPASQPTAAKGESVDQAK